MLLTRRNKLKKKIGELKTLIDEKDKSTTQKLNKVLDVVRSIDIPTPKVERVEIIKPEVRVETREVVKEIDPEALDDLEQDVEDLRKLILKSGGGNANRQMFISGVNPLSKYTDVNLKAGNNVTLTYADNNATKKVDVTITAAGGGPGGGITRVITSVAVDTNAGADASTDYVYLVSGTTTLTLPTAVGNTNLYTVKNVGDGIVTIATTGAETIDDSPTVTLAVKYTSVDIESDSVNWNIT